MFKPLVLKPGEFWNADVCCPWQAWFWETPTVWPRFALSPATRSWGSWSPKVWPQTCPRTCTTWSRRLWPSESTWRETERYGSSSVTFKGWFQDPMFVFWVRHQMIQHRWTVLIQLQQHHHKHLWNWCVAGGPALLNNLVFLKPEICFWWRKDVSTLFFCRIRTPSSVWFSSRAGSTGWPGTTRPRESWPPTGSSTLLFFFFTGTVHCPALLSVSAEIFLMC